MIRKAAAALTGLGLIGGAGSVAYNNHGDATVRIKDANGQVHVVRISSSDGKSFSCSSETHDRLASMDIRLGRIKLTMQGVRSAERKIEQRYPTGKVPASVVARYKALARRDDRLVDAYNAEVDAHNAIISRDCTPESNGPDS